jgi:hypothetical protein
MNKLKMIGILLIAIGGALLIYTRFEKKKNDEIVINKFNSEYNINDEENVFAYKNIDEILDLFESKTGIVFLCTPTSKWCKKYAHYLNETLKENNYTDEVYYLDISKERSLDSIKYQRLLTYLDNYLYKNDQNVSKINMPDLSFVKDGMVIAHDNETSLIASDVEENEYWNQNQIYEFKNKIRTYVEEIK